MDEQFVPGKIFLGRCSLPVFSSLCVAFAVHGNSKSADLVL